MRDYRLVILLKSGLSKEQKEKLLTEVKKYAGKLEKEQVVEHGEKKLFYPIKKERKAEFVELSFSSEKVTDELERRVGMRNEILRHLLVRSN